MSKTGTEQSVRGLELGVVSFDEWAHPEAESAEEPAGSEEREDTGTILAALKERYNTEALRHYRTERVALDSLTVEGEEHVRASAAGMTGSIELFGVLQAPAVLEHPDGRREVIYGRRRVVGARRAGEADIEVRIYTGVSRAQMALLILTENVARGPAWVRDVQMVSELRRAGTLMTEAELKAMLGGRRLPYIREILRMATLPEPVLELILDGKVTQRLAARVARLRGRDMDRIAEMALSGSLDEHAIELALRAATQELSPLLATVLDEEEVLTPAPAQAAPEAAPLSTEAEPAGKGRARARKVSQDLSGFAARAAEHGEAPPTPAALREMLRGALEGGALTPRATVLARALAEELRRL
jgi:ParB/RepB/Spo0J family partition protein